MAGCVGMCEEAEAGERPRAGLSWQDGDRVHLRAK